MIILRYLCYIDNYWITSDEIGLHLLLVKSALIEIFRITCSFSAVLMHWTSNFIVFFFFLKILNRCLYYQVENLFYNMIARRKTLQNSADDYSKIVDLLSRFAVHHIHVGFSCRKVGCLTNEACLYVRLLKSRPYLGLEAFGIESRITNLASYQISTNGVGFNKEYLIQVSSLGFWPIY